MNLFQYGDFQLHSGSQSSFKIDCDGLLYRDLASLAALFSEKYTWSGVIGIPRGGLRFAECLSWYSQPGTDYPLLIADDVLTTGASMEKKRAELTVETFGVVIFARGNCPDWITPIFRTDFR